MKSRKTQISVSGVRLAVAGLLLSGWLADGYAQGGPPPIITLQPAAQTVPSGGTASFAVGVATIDTTLTYQWRFNGARIAGATNSVYARNNVQYTNAGLYSVAVTNGGGFAISSNAALTVINTPLRFVAVGWGSMGLTGRLEGPIGASYVLSVSTNLRDWAAISTNLSQTGSADFSDPSSTNRPHSFYRGSLQ